MVHDGADVTSPARLDAVQVRFDEERLISDAGLLLCATLADRLGIEELVNESVWLGYGTPGAAMPGRKVMTLVAGMLAGADSIDDMNLLRAGSTGLVLGHRVMAPSTLGTFLRAFTFGQRPSARPRPGRRAGSGVAGRSGSGRRAAGGRSGQLRRRGLQLPQAGRGLWLHPRLRVSPVDCGAGGHR